jgi:hypothetical protein
MIELFTKSSRQHNRALILVHDPAGRLGARDFRRQLLERHAVFPLAPRAQDSRMGAGPRGHRWTVAQLAVALPFAVASAPACPAEDWLPPVVEIPAGPFIAGQETKEREFPYQLDERAYGEPITRRQRWYEASRWMRAATGCAFTPTCSTATRS